MRKQCLYNIVILITINKQVILLAEFVTMIYVHLVENIFYFILNMDDHTRFIKGLNLNFISKL